MPVTDEPIPALLRGLASQQPHAPAFTFIDYELDPPPGQPAAMVRFDYEKLSAGHAKRCGNERGVELVSYGPPRASTLRIVDPETRVENPAGKVGEIWVHGDNIAGGYWRRPQASERRLPSRGKGQYTTGRTER